MESDQKIKLTILSPNETFYRNEVFAVSCKNKQGNFDILPYHANFMSLINQEIEIQQTDGTKKEIKVDKGILRVFENQVTILLNVESELSLH